MCFNHAMIYVRDVRRALGFYRDLLGFKLIEQFEAGGSPVYARLRSPLGLTTLALHKLGPGRRLPRSCGIRLYFEARDLDRLCARLKGKVNSLEKPKKMPWGWTHAYLRDPDGYELSLYRAGEKRFRPTPRTDH